MTSRDSAKKLVILGAGGQARELAWYIEDCNRSGESFEVVGFLVSDLTRLGALDSVDRVLGDYDWLRTHHRELDGLALGIGLPSSRLRVANALVAEFPELEWPMIVHPRACVDRASASLGRGITIGPGVVGTVNVIVEDFALLNFGATIGHEARIGAGTVVNPGANISGGVTLGSGVLVGAGAVVLQYVSVGAGSTVGAGAVVTKDVPAGATVVGVPAKPVSRE